MTDPCANPEFLVLIVEDEPAALRLIEEALREDGRPTGYIVATDGVEAFDVLYGRGRYTGARRPDLILLDLDLPRVSGQKLLAELKAHDDVKSIPVVVFSQTDDTATVAECYDRGANAYIEKPMDYDGVLFIIETLLDFWADGAETPSGQSRADSFT